MQGIRTAQNLDYLALCVQAEALRSAAAAELHSHAGAVLAKQEPSLSRDFIHQCLQLLYAALPRHGRRGQRQVSSDVDIYEAMAWFQPPDQGLRSGQGGQGTVAGQPSPARLRALQMALATSQRHLWMLFRLCDLRSLARPASVQGTLAALLGGQLRPIVWEHRLKLDSAPSCDEASDRALRTGTHTPSDDSGRILGDLDSTASQSQDGESDGSFSTVQRILASGLGSEAGRTGKSAGSSGQGDLGEGRSGDSQEAASVSAVSDDALSFQEGDEMQRILAASDASDGASSDSASSAGFQSFGITHSSMWSGMSRSDASSASSITGDLFAHRRPLLEGYASALRPLFMTRGDIMHLLLKFPKQVLLGLGGNAGSRSFAAHRELLEELFGSVVVAVKSPERRGKIKLAFGASFAYGTEQYALGPMQTRLLLVAHGVRRTGQDRGANKPGVARRLSWLPRVPVSSSLKRDMFLGFIRVGQKGTAFLLPQEPFPVVYEEEDEDELKSEAAVSVARDDCTEHGGGQNVLEFEEVVVPLTEVSSRELFLAELMQSDQCQLLASLSQGSHSKYGHRALRRRRRTRHSRASACCH